MSIIKGYQLAGIKAGINNPHLASNLNEFVSDYFPYHESLLKKVTYSQVKHRVAKAITRKIKSFMPLRYSDLWYNRIHITPSQIDFGNIVSTQEVTFYVWNAHFETKRLIAINGASDGLIIEGKKAPYTYQALEEQSYKLTVTPDGSSVIDDEIVFDFNNERPSLIVTGDRVVAFSFMPNWTEGITEKLEWSTDILDSESGFEQRSALYLTPRRTLEADFIIHDNERQYFNNMMAWGAKNWAVPLWPYIQTLQQPIKQGDTTLPCTTKDIEFSKGGLVFLYRDFTSYEIAEVAQVNSDGLILKRPLQADWSHGTRIYPAKSAYFSKQPSLTRKTDNLQTVSIEFFIDGSNPFTAAAPSDNYLGYPVLMLRPDESDDLTTQYQRLLETLDNKMALPLVHDVSGYSFLIQSYQWLGMGREERSTFRALAYYLNGKQKALWIPSHADDLTVVDTVTANEPVLTINACGYSRFAKNDPDKRHIVIYLNDGTYYFRKIVDSEAIAGKERLALDSVIGKQLKPSEIQRICFMRLCRSNSDTVAIKHLTDSEGVASSQLTFKRVRDNEY